MNPTQNTTVYELLTSKQSSLDEGYRAGCWACNDDGTVKYEDPDGEITQDSCPICQPRGRS